jgi:hypothetical protein
MSDTPETPSELPPVTAAAPDAPPSKPRRTGPAKASSPPLGDSLKKEADTASEKVGEKVEDVFRAFEKGREDAIEAAAKVAPGLKRAAAKGAYMFCYYLAFGAVYSAELVMSAVPQDSPIRHGFTDGADAAKAAHAQHKQAGGLPQAA